VKRKSIKFIYFTYLKNEALCPIVFLSFSVFFPYLSIASHLLKNKSSFKKLIQEISTKVIEVIGDSSYHVDHGGLYARIRGNYCPYHADNISFFCPIHGKNQQELRSSCPGNCPGSQYIPNHTPWREYTALIYLNDDFQGGEIAFEDGPCNQIYQKVIPIEAYMLVLAPNGPHFYHEVYPIKQGKRHSLHLWYTRDPSHYLHF